MKGMRSIAPFGVRMPDDLKQRLTVRADQNGRSLNSEILMILQHAVESASPATKSSAEHQAAILADEFKKIVYDTLVKIYSEKNNPQ